MTKSKLNLLFLKNRFEASKVRKSSLKPLDFVTPIPLDTVRGLQICHTWPVIKETR